MLFSSLTFLYIFLPIMMLLYFLVPKSQKNLVLLVFSLFFYAWGGVTYALIMVVVITLGYIYGLLIEKFREKNKKLAKLFLFLSVATIISFMLYYKYAYFLVSNIASIPFIEISDPFLKSLREITLPIGISFFTFQILSYTVDVYWGVKAQRSWIKLAAYISMFPQLIAGPIVRYTDVAAELDNRTHSLENFHRGGRRFIIGLSKKILVANVLGELCDIFKASGEKSVVFFWVYAVAFALHIYFDFSAYSDMAIGLGRIMGFSFLENFNYPFISASITEFWRRWHMSLGSWFRDYVYIPLGGNRCSKLRNLFNICVVWFLTGMWHGAEWNFAVWGIMFAALLMVEKLFLLKYLKKSHVLSRVYVIFFMLVSFVIFNANNMGEAVEYLKGMFFMTDIPLINKETTYYLTSYLPMIIAAIIGSTPLVSRLFNKAEKTKTGNVVFAYAEPIVLGALLLICTAFLVDGSYNPFLYFRF